MIAGNCSLKIREAKEFGRAPRLIIEKHYSARAERIRGHLTGRNIARAV